MECGKNHTAFMLDKTVTDIITLYVNLRFQGYQQLYYYYLMHKEVVQWKNRTLLKGILRTI